MKRTAIHDIMTRSIRGSTVWACRATRWTLKYARENPMLEEDIRLFYNVLGEDGELLGERFSVLARLLREMGY